MSDISYRACFTQRRKAQR